MPICTQCGSRSEEGARFCGNCGAPVSAAVIPNPPEGTGAPPLPVLPKPRISRGILKFIAYGSAIAAAIFILFAIFAIVFPAPSNQSGGSQPSVVQAPLPQKTAAQRPNATIAKAAQPTPDNSTATASPTKAPQVVHEVIDFPIFVCPTRDIYEQFSHAFGSWMNAYLDQNPGKTFEDIPEKASDNAAATIAAMDGCTQVPSGTSVSEEITLDDLGLPNLVSRISARMPDGTVLTGFGEGGAKTQ